MRRNRETKPVGGPVTTYRLALYRRLRCANDQQQRTICMMQRLQCFTNILPHLVEPCEVAGGFDRAYSVSEALKFLEVIHRRTSSSIK